MVFLTRRLEGTTAAHLFELSSSRRLLREQGRLDPVEQSLQPADELGLGDAQFRFTRNLPLQREEDRVQLFLEVGGENI